MILKGGKMAKFMREMKDEKQKELAEKLEISASYVSELEGDNKKPSADLLRKWSQLVGFTMDVYFEGRKF